MTMWLVGVGDGDVILFKIGGIGVDAVHGEVGSGYEAGDVVGYGIEVASGIVTSIMVGYVDGIEA